MSKRSSITGKGPSYGNNVPFSKKRSRRRWEVNLQERRIWVPELNRFIKLRVTTRDLRSIDAHGLLAYLRSNGKTLADVS
ncbi:MAG: 50S ribosomal protein L28 [Anaerolineales bacterium]|nr:MAG: 50S ribosomal protein L28 [Anaerolineales bacterium]